MKMPFKSAAALLGIALSMAFPSSGSCQNAEIQAEIFEVLGVLKSGLDEPTRTKLSNMEIIVPNTLSFTHIGADVGTGGRRIISFNVGSYVRLVELGDAVFLTTAIIKNGEYLNGYVRYLAYADLMGKDLLTARQFAKYYGYADIDAKVNVLPVAAKSLAGSMKMTIIAFILAHEIAHHVNDDPLNSDNALPARRLREERADRFAAELIAKLGMSPAIAAFSLLIFNELDSRNAAGEGSSNHPAGMKRTLHAVEYSVQYLRENEAQVSAALKDGMMGTSYESLLAGSNTILAMMREKAAKQENMDKDATALRNSGIGGDRFSQLKIGELYLSGEWAEFPYSIDSAIYWYEVAANNQRKFDYFDDADANYRAGQIYGFSNELKRDYAKACRYLKRSAGKSYSPGVHAFTLLLRGGKCT